MQKYLYFLASDAEHLQTRLERLAQKGFELISTEGFFTGCFEHTDRIDLSYCVFPCRRGSDLPLDEIRSCGWEAVGGFNGMIILKSLPCAEPDSAALEKRLKQSGCFHPDQWSARIVVMLSVLCALAFFTVDRWFDLGPWYATYGSMGVACFRWVAVILAAANLLTLRSYVSAWVHGLTPWIVLGMIFGCLMLAQLDESQHTVYFVCILLALSAASILTLWNRARVLSVVVTGICIAVLISGLLFPNISQTAGVGQALRSSISDRNLITLSDLGDNTLLRSSEYSSEGTFLSRTEEYWEESGSSTISVARNACLTDHLADCILSSELNSGSWTETGFGWQNASGNAVLMRSGNTVIKVIYSERLTQEQVEIIQEHLQ